MSDRGEGSPQSETAGESFSLDGQAASNAELEQARQVITFLEGLAFALGDDAAQALYEIGQLKLHPLDDAKGALEALKEAFARWPALHVARAYRRAALRAGSVDDQLIALEAEARAAGSPGYRAALELERGTLLEREVGNLPAARQAYAAAVELNPSDLASLIALLRLALRDGDVDAQVAQCKKIAEATQDARVKAEHLAWAGRILDAAGQREPALAAGVQADVHASDSPSVRFLLERLFDQKGQIAELVALLHAEIADGSALAHETWLEIGLCARYQLGDLELAERALTLVAEASQGVTRQAVLGELSDLWIKKGEHQKAIDAELERMPDEADRLGRAIAWTRVGLLREEKLGDLDGAAEAFGRAVEAWPSHVPALEAAGRVWVRKNDLDKLTWMHKLEAEHATSPADRAGALRRAGELLVADAARVDDGIALLHEALAAAPDHGGVLSALERALRRKGAWAALCDLYQRELERAGEPERKAWLLIQIGELAADRLDDRPRAIAALRSAAEIPGGAPHFALARLSQLLEDEGSAKELESVLGQLSAVTADPLQLASLSERAASLQEQRGDEAAALETYRRAIASAPPSHSIHASAGRAFARAERWDDLVGLYERTIAHGSDAERASYGCKAGVLYARKLGRADEGIARLEAVRATAPGHLPACLALAALYEEQGKWAELRPVLAELPSTPGLLVKRAAIADATGHGDEALELWQRAIEAGVTLGARPRTRILARLGRWRELAAVYARAEGNGSGKRAVAHARFRAAELHLERLKEPERAAELIAAALASEPDSVPLLYAAVRAEPESSPAWRSAVDALTAQIKDPALCAALLRMLAASPQLSPGEALVARVKQMGLQPRDPGVTVRIEQALEERHNRPAMAAMLKDVGQDGKADPLLVASAQARLGGLQEELGSLREAADAYEAALSGGQPSYVARLALPRIYAALGDQPRVIESLRALCDLLPKGAERASALRRLAALHRRRGETGTCALALEEALSAHPLDFAALRELDAVVGASEPERLIDPLMRAFAQSPIGPARRDVGLALAARLVRAGRLGPARDVLDRLLAEDATELRAWLLRAEVDERAQAWPSLVEALSTIAEHSEAETELQAEALRRQTLVELEQLSDLAAARATAGRLGERAPSSLGALEVRLKVAEGAEDHAEAASLYAALIGHAGIDDERRAALQLKLASLKEVKLDDVAGAIETLGAIQHPARRRDAVDRLLDLGGRTGRWDLAASALEATLDRKGEMDAQWELAIRSRLANLLEGPLDRKDAAARQYERIVAIDPGHVPALERLAELSAKSAPDRAIDYHRALLAVEPARLTSLRALRQLFIAVGEEDGAFLTEALLEGVGLADEEESYFYKQRRARLHGPTDGVLTDEERGLLCPEAALPAFALLRAFLTPLLGSVFPVDYAGYGVDAGEAPPGPATGAAAYRAAKLFDVGSFRMLAVANRVGPCVEPGAPPVLLVPRNLEDATPRDQACVLGELMARIAFDAILGDPRRLNAMTPALLDHVLWAACELALPEAVAPQRGRPVYEDVKRRLGQALAAVDASRGELADAARQLMAAGGFTTDGILAAMARTALRAAVFSAQDPAIAIAGARDKSESGRGLDSLPKGLLAVVPFCVSRAHLALRVRLGIGVTK